jgi:hypothetical protein
LRDDQPAPPGSPALHPAATPQPHAGHGAG